MRVQNCLDATRFHRLMFQVPLEGCLNMFFLHCAKDYKFKFVPTKGKIKKLRRNHFILRLLAITLLVGILVNFGCEFDQSSEPTDQSQADLNDIKIGQLSTPTSSLFSRQPTEEENEVFHYSPHQPVLNQSEHNSLLNKILGLPGTSLSEIRGLNSISSFDIIISQHRLIV